jgi:hypothetical protein
LSIGDSSFSSALAFDASFFALAALAKLIDGLMFAEVVDVV